MRSHNPEGSQTSALQTQADGSLGALYRSIFIWNLFTEQRDVVCNPPAPPSEPVQGGKGLVAAWRGGVFPLTPEMFLYFVGSICRTK